MYLLVTMTTVCDTKWLWFSRLLDGSRRFSMGKDSSSYTVHIWFCSYFNIYSSFVIREILFSSKRNDYKHELNGHAGSVWTVSTEAAFTWRDT